MATTWFASQSGEVDVDVHVGSFPADDRGFGAFEECPGQVAHRIGASLGGGALVVITWWRYQSVDRGQEPLTLQSGQSELAFDHPVMTPCEA